MRGNWGLEGTFSTFESLARSPGWLCFDGVGVVSGTPEVFFPTVASRADVFLGQVVRVFPLSGSTEWFVGLGGGWMRAADTDHLFLGTPMPNDLDEYPTGLPPDFFVGLVPEVELTADRSSVAYSGSLGLAFRTGRLLLRPRLDVIVAHALTTELTVGFDLPQVAALVTFFPLLAAGDDGLKDRRSKVFRLRAETSTPDGGSTPWEVQVFVRGALAGLRSHGEFAAGFRGDVRGVFTEAAIPAETTMGSGNQTSWGAGVRALRGLWGFDVQHHRLGTGMFSPAGVFRETGFLDAVQIPVPTQTGDVFSAMALREFPLGDRRRRLFLGAGAGYFLMGGDDSLRIFELTPVVHLGASMAGTLLEERRGGRFRMAEGGFHMDRGALVFGASLGLTLDFGRILVRPRLDVFTGQARESAEEMPMASDVPGHRFGGTMTVTTAARPQLLLFTVDVGWSFRP